MNERYLKDKLISAELVHICGTQIQEEDCVKSLITNCYSWKGAPVPLLCTVQHRCRINRTPMQCRSFNSKKGIGGGGGDLYKVQRSAFGPIRHIFIHPK